MKNVTRLFSGTGWLLPSVLLVVMVDTLLLTSSPRRRLFLSVLKRSGESRTSDVGKGGRTC